MIVGKKFFSVKYNVSCDTGGPFDTLKVKKQLVRESILLHEKPFQHFEGNEAVSSRKYSAS